MRPVVVVIADTAGHEAFTVAFVEHDDIIEKSAAAGADESFGYAILPRAFEGCANRFHAKGLYRLDSVRTEDNVPVMDQVSRSRIVGEGFAQLLDHPRAGRMFGDVEMQDSPLVMSDDEKNTRHRRSTSAR
jgi:hypothetical protein